MFEFLKQNKKYLLLIIPVLILIILYYVSLFVSTSGYTPETPTITPDVLNYNTYVYEDVNFTISFPSDLPNGPRNNVKVAFQPAAKFDSTWASAGTLVISPNPYLQRGKEYKISVFYKDDEIASRTVYVNNKSLQQAVEDISEQARLDYEFGDRLSNITNDYPWYDKLPITSPDYTVVYDYDLKKFRIRIQRDSDAPKEEIDTYISQALLRLSAIKGVPKNFEYYVLMKDE